MALLSTRIGLETLDDEDFGEAVEVLGLLFHRLESDEIRVRLECAWSLCQLLPESPAGRRAWDRLEPVLTALDDRRGLESLAPRLEAASALVERDESGAEIVELCLEALRCGIRPHEDLLRSAGIRQQAASVLGAAGPWPEGSRVCEALLRVARFDVHDEVRDTAYRAWTAA